MEVQIAAAKINKYAASESGDTLEVVERPHGGVSIVLADGQSTGRGGKAVSMLVVHKVIGLLADGVRDGAAARAASDYLFVEKNGAASCVLNIVSVDLRTKTIVLASNNPLPVFVIRRDVVDALNTDSSPIGLGDGVRAVITEIPLEVGLTVVIYTDGLARAGERRGQPMDIVTTLHGLLDENDPVPQEVADVLVAQALRLDDNRPVDDISVVVVRVMPQRGDHARRLTMRLPIQSG